MKLISKNFTNRQKMIIWSLLFVFIIFGIVYFVIIPTAAYIKTLKKEVIDKKFELYQNKNSESDFNNIKENLSIVEKQISEFDDIFINHNRELEFITVLEDIAQKNQIEQKISLDPNKVSNDKNLLKTNLRIEAQGTFYDLISYLQSLENSSYYININTISFSSNKNTRNSALKAPAQTDAPEQVYLTFDADTYWQ